jgi:GGDEF domain-containing protein
MLEYLRSPVERLEMASIRHPKLGIYNERYFQLRLIEEINRAHTQPSAQPSFPALDSDGRLLAAAR